MRSLRGGKTVFKMVFDCLMRSFAGRIYIVRRPLQYEAKLMVASFGNCLLVSF